jgi:DNA helicase-2/ATP-dependent DNA helicase PcrA
MLREPQASVAVLTRDVEGADLVYQALARGNLSHLRRIVDQEFAFEPGIEVCDAAQTKGLEFDYVVLLGVDRQSYPDTPAARHLLHVGATRAIHQLWLLSWEPLSLLLPDWLEPHLAG